MQFPSDLLENIRIQLEKDKTRISQQIDELTKQDPFSNPERLNDNAASDMDASEESDHDRVIAQIEELKLKTEEINDALIRIGEGTYGYCKSCNALIDTDRLSVLPATSLCVDCENARNQKAFKG